MQISICFTSKQSGVLGFMNMKRTAAFMPIIGMTSAEGHNIFSIQKNSVIFGRIKNKLLFIIKAAPTATTASEATVEKNHSIT